MTSDPITLRLRRANPVPRAVAVEADELFAAITAARPDRRLRREVRHRQRVLVVALVLLVMALVASTALAISDWLGEAVKPSVTKQEYPAAQKELALPPGASWPTFRIEPNSVTGRGAGGGHAVLVAQNAWECYWVHAIREGDNAAAARAQSVLTGLLAQNVLEAPVGASENWTPPNPPDRPYVVFAADGGLDWVRQTYALAAAGKPLRLIQSCNANAPG